MGNEEDGSIAKELESMLGCLRELRTADDLAKRRYGNVGCDGPDEDLLGGENPFDIDACNKLGPSKALRRLGDKTQVYLPLLGNPHIRNRRSHTDEVVNIATQICGILGLNVNLARAIALGHDIGHAPFGHCGERFLSEQFGSKFRHELFGPIIAQKIERNGKGLNLTIQTLKGMLEHSGGLGTDVGFFSTPESYVVMVADKIAYLTADFNDIFIRYNFRNQLEVKELMEACGRNQRTRVRYFIYHFCKESVENGKIQFSQSEGYLRLSEIKRLMSSIYPLFDNSESPEMFSRVLDFLESMFSKLDKKVDPRLAFALMTDGDVMSLHRKSNLNVTDLSQTSVWELVTALGNVGHLDPTQPELDW